MHEIQRARLILYHNIFSIWVNLRFIKRHNNIDELSTSTREVKHKKGLFIYGQLSIINISTHEWTVKEDHVISREMTNKTIKNIHKEDNAKSKIWFELVT